MFHTDTTHSEVNLLFYSISHFPTAFMILIWYHNQHILLHTPNQVTFSLFVGWAPKHNEKAEWVIIGSQNVWKVIQNLSRIFANPFSLFYSLGAQPSLERRFLCGCTEWCFLARLSIPRNHAAEQHSLGGFLMNFQAVSHSGKMATKSWFACLHQTCTTFSLNCGSYVYSVVASYALNKHNTFCG
jgi:hypothetical protein